MQLLPTQHRVHSRVVALKEQYNCSSISIKLYIGITYLHPRLSFDRLLIPRSVEVQHRCGHGVNLSLAAV